MRSIARSLGLAETNFDDAFRNGISTLRLIHYPERRQASLDGVDPDKLWVEHRSRRRYLVTAAHIDSGFVTLLAQEGVEGLQARAADGSWVDVPPLEGTLAVNFGGLLARWTDHKIKATEHRVLGPGRARFSIPFFYEPRFDAAIAPLPGSGAGFAPFHYGDHLWEAATKFAELKGLENVRAPTGRQMA
jgi:isopenicillin N synthase-like dioxygenase